MFGTSRNVAPNEVRQGINLLRCDVTDDEFVKQVIEEVVGLAGRIDVLVNNAGRSLIGGAEELSVGQAQGLFDINVFGIIRTTNAALPIMRKQGTGRIINISSVAGFLPGPYTALYNATKHAVEGYSELLDHELRSFGIRVSLIEPAFTRTALEENGEQPIGFPASMTRGDRPRSLHGATASRRAIPWRPWRTRWCWPPLKKSRASGTRLEKRQAVFASCGATSPKRPSTRVSASRWALSIDLSDRGIAERDSHIS